MRKLALILTILLFANGLFAQSINGDWYGKLTVQGTTVHIVFHIQKTSNGYSSTMDSPDQGANGIGTDTTKFDSNKLEIVAAKFGLIYSGSYEADSNVIYGTFKQGSISLPLILSHNKNANIQVVAPPMSRRPQDPTDYPYKREEVNFQNKNANVTLAGTLTLPALVKPSKIVILITGSGPQNRDEELGPLNHRPFLIWSDWLTRQGIAVLRYDDRGIAQSTGNFSTATTLDFATDVEAAINFIKSRQDLKQLSLGLIGHSEGGMIAPIVASRNKNVDFIVLLAGPGIPIKDLMVKQTDDQLRLTNTPANIAAVNHYGAIEVFNYLAKNSTTADAILKPQVEQILRNNFSKYPQNALNGMAVNDLVQKQVSAYLLPWFKYFISFDPEAYLTKVHCPVLAVNGTLDSQVSAEQNLPAIHKYLSLAGNKNFKTIPLTDLNHLMQKARTGSVAEYSTIDETVDPLALTTVSSWINSLH